MANEFGKGPGASEMLASLRRYVQNKRLFSSSCFERLLSNPDYPIVRTSQDRLQAKDRLCALIRIWEKSRSRFVVDKSLSGHRGERNWEGLPPNLCPVEATSESDVEQGVIRAIAENLMGYYVVNNNVLKMHPDVAAELGATDRQRPDMVLFKSESDFLAAVERAKSGPAGSSAGVRFCRDSLFILDAKRFSKGVGAGEGLSDDEYVPKKVRDEKTAWEDVNQVDRYLRGYNKKWGILTNGRTWRLMLSGATDRYLRFDLVLLLEEIRSRNGDVSESDLAAFELFWQLFGQSAVGGGILDSLLADGEKETRNVRDTLRQHAHAAVEEIARGFWRNQDNQYPQVLSQEELDHLRETSLTFLYRLLFVLKAEAQNLLPMRDEMGNSTTYEKTISTRRIFDGLRQSDADALQGSLQFESVRRLFGYIDTGSKQYGVAAYDGGLFDPEHHQELNRLSMLDDSLFMVLKELIYIDENSRSPVPYQDLDVRDLGDIYEGLLELRLVSHTVDGRLDLKLTNQKGERKASGSYFTPDSLVDAIVRKTVLPLLEASGDDAGKILNLKILDPAMGSGHFLVKVVDVMAGYLTSHCDPLDAGAPADDGPAEFAYWKAKVAEHCIYGVDYNPMAVELAKVSLWLHTARSDRPLSFLDHHLKVGNSLVGAPLNRLHELGLKAAERKGKAVWQAVSTSAKGRKPVAVEHAHDVGKLELPVKANPSMWTRIVRNIRAILAQPSDASADVKAKRKAYQEQVQAKLEAHRLLADLWCAQWFLVEPGSEGNELYGSGGVYTRLRKISAMENDDERTAALAAIKSHPIVRRIADAREKGYGPRPGAFFHWELEFPEVAFDENGLPRDGFGFDAVVGNPPWDKIKPEKRQFYAPFSEEVANTQGASLAALIERLEHENVGLAGQWAEYEKRLARFTEFLRDSGGYCHQTAVVGKKKTGGDPDLFRYFVERSLQSLRSAGRLGLVIPGTLWQGESCTGLRRHLLQDATVEETHVFENYRKWAFGIDSRFKFIVLVVRADKAPSDHRFAASFMVRDPKVLDGLLPERIVRLSADDVRVLSPETLALLDFKCDEDAQLVLRLHRSLPALGAEESGWKAVYCRELDMTNDAWKFKSRDWMRSRGFTQVIAVRDPDGTWRQVQNFKPAGVKLPDPLPPGGEYWVAPDVDYFRHEFRRNSYEERTVPDGREARLCFIAKDDLRIAQAEGARRDEKHFLIYPGALYVPLYEGRMVHNFDHCQKAYISGQGRKAVWRELPMEEKHLQPRVFVSESEGNVSQGTRIGACDVTGATNERTTLASPIPHSCAAGHKVPVLYQETPGQELVLACLLNSFVLDWVVRMRVSTNLVWYQLASVPVPSLTTIPSADLCWFKEVACRLACTTPELAAMWNEVFPQATWTYRSAERNQCQRAQLRADIDARLAELYGLPVPEYARILTSFPLLDRSQVCLPGDYFLTEGDASLKRRHPNGEGTKWVENDAGIFELAPRSFITRDFALITYMVRKGYEPPTHLDDWYRDVVGIDPDGPLSRFKIGEVKELAERVNRAREAGAVPYVPTGRGGGSDEDSDVEVVDLDDELAGDEE